MSCQRLATLVACAVMTAAAAPLFAQEPPADPAPAESVAPAEGAAPCCILPARTMLVIEFVDTVNSRLNETVQSFAFRLAEPLTVDGRVVVPAGTPGVGEVVHAARARAMGKAGELILAVRYLQLGETRIRLRSLRYGRQGLDNSQAAFAVAMVATPLAFVIAGGEVNVPAGTQANAQTAEEIVLAPVE